MHLRQYLEGKQLTQAEFGDLLEPPVSQGKVSHWLEGSRRVSLAEGLQILALTGGEVTLPELAAMYRGGGIKVGRIRGVSIGAPVGSMSTTGGV